MPVTIHDVAQRLGLSIATVSRALAGHSEIALKTRQLVQQTAQEMGYSPNQAARQLRRQKADAIGYILPVEADRFSDPFYAEFLVGLGDETAVHPFDLLVSVSSKDNAVEQRLYEKWVQSQKVDGFVLNRIRHDDWRVRYLSEHGVPFATLEQGEAGFDQPYVAVDNRAGMVAVVQHLAQSGYHRLAFIGGPEYLVIHSARLAGFRLGLEQVGLPFHAEYVVNGNLTSDGGYQAVKQMRWQTQRMRWVPDPPDALVCINDETAIGALHAVHELGLMVGQDVAVTGFDGVQAARHTDPPLTTLEIPIYEIARQLVRLLVDEINGGSPDRQNADRQTVFQPRLLARTSSQKQ